MVRGRAAWTEPSGRRTQIRFTDTWLKRDDRWQCVATHESNAGRTSEDTDVSAITRLTPEHKKLAMRAGDWTWTGEQVNIDSEDSPYGQAGTFSGRSEERAVLGGLFLQSQWQENNPAGQMGGWGMTTYDPQKKCYVTYDFMNDGTVNTGTFTLDGTVERSMLTFPTKKGGQLLARIVTNYATDFLSSESTWEVSVDNGNTWKHWAKLRREKAKN